MRAADIPDAPGAERTRRVRDAVEAALSDIILLGTEKQVRLAAQAAQELASGKLIHTEDLVVSLRTFIRNALDLEAIPTDVVIPRQGPARQTAGGKDKGDKAEGRQNGGGGGGLGGGGRLGGTDWDLTRARTTSTGMKRRKMLPRLLITVS